VGGDDDAFVGVVVAVDAVEGGRELVLAEALAVGGDDGACDAACGAEGECGEGGVGDGVDAGAGVEHSDDFVEVAGEFAGPAESVDGAGEWGFEEFVEAVDEADAVAAGGQGEAVRAGAGSAEGFGGGLHGNGVVVLGTSMGVLYLMLLSDDVRTTAE
jgi:hypothetical protein